MTKDKRGSKILSYTLPTLAVAGGMGALSYLRNRLQAHHLYTPGRYPDGVWDPRPFGLPAEEARFAAEDGVELHGWWIPHPRARGSVLHCHGSSGSIAHQIAVYRFLRRLRVNLFVFDYRGYGRSRGEPSERGLCLDARAAHDHMTGPLARRPEEILIVGHSLGGAVAIDCAVDRPAAGLVVESSFTHVRDAARSHTSALPIHLAARKQFRSIEKIGALELPKLIVHGEADTRVPAELGRRLFDAAAEPKELFLVPGADHHDLHRRGGARYLEVLGRFRDRCLERLDRVDSLAVD